MISYLLEKLFEHFGIDTVKVVFYILFDCIVLTLLIGVTALYLKVYGV